MQKLMRRPVRRYRRGRPVVQQRDAWKSVPLLVRLFVWFMCLSALGAAAVLVGVFLIGVVQLS